MIIPYFCGRNHSPQHFSMKTFGRNKKLLYFCCIAWRDHPAWDRERAYIRERRLRNVCPDGHELRNFNPFSGRWQQDVCAQCVFPVPHWWSLFHRCSIYYRTYWRGPAVLTILKRKGNAKARDRRIGRHVRGTAPFLCAKENDKNNLLR